MSLRPWSFVIAICLFNISSIPALATDKSAPCIPRRYTAIELPLLPVHVNNSGQVTGMTARHEPAVWTNSEGRHETFSLAAFSTMEVTHSNNAGDLAGAAANNRDSKAFIYKNKKLTLLPGEHAKAFSLNDSNQAVGESTLPGRTSSQPILWDGQTSIDLGACCGGTAKDINNHGQVIGDSYDDHAKYHAFLWTRTNGLRRLDRFPGFSSAIAINDAGHIVVQAMSEGIFLYKDGTLTPLKLSPTQPNSPHAINNCDVVVGAYGPFSDVERAFAWDPTRGFVDLNDLLPPNSGWKLESSTSINDRGEIVGRGDHGADDVGFLLIPQW